MGNFTFVILTFNEEKNLPACLASMKGIDAPIFAVDSYSTDNTLKILEEHGVPYVQHPFDNYAKQRNWAQANLPIETEWVFHLDAGEQLTEELREWLSNSFEAAAKQQDGFMFSRRTIFFDKWIKYGGHYPNYHLRLYKKGLGKCEEKVYDQHFVLDGRALPLPKGVDIIDTVAENLKDFTQSHSKWAYFEAVEILSKSSDTGEVSASFFGSPIERRRWLKNNVFQKMPLFSRSFLYFFYRYFVRLGFLDGKIGLVFHLLQGFWFRFMVDSVVVELQQKMDAEKLPLRVLIQQKYDPSLLKIMDAESK